MVPKYMHCERDSIPEICIKSCMHAIALNSVFPLLVVLDDSESSDV